MSDDRVQREPDIKLRSRMKELEKWSKWRARAIKESDGDVHQALLIGHALLTDIKRINKVLAETNKTLAAVYKEVSGEDFDWESCERRKAELFDGFASAVSKELKTMEGENGE